MLGVELISFDCSQGVARTDDVDRRATKSQQRKNVKLDRTPVRSLSHRYGILSNRIKSFVVVRIQLEKGSSKRTGEAAPPKLRRR